MPGRTGQESEQERICGLLKLPLAITVKPKVLPLPLARMVIMLPLLSQLGEPLQVVETRCGGVTATTTTQLLPVPPLTVTEPLNRSLHRVPAV